MCEACEICTRSVIPTASIKISLNHVNQGFNDDVQIYFTYVYERDSKRVALHMVDAGTAQSKTQTFDDRSMKTTIKAIENTWLNVHGAPNCLSTDY